MVSTEQSSEKGISTILFQHPPDSIRFFSSEEKKWVALTKFISFQVTLSSVLDIT